MKGFVRGRKDGRTVCKEVSESGMRERLRGLMDGDWEGEWKRRRGAEGEGGVGS